MTSDRRCCFVLLFREYDWFCTEPVVDDRDRCAAHQKMKKSAYLVPEDLSYHKAHALVTP